MPIHPAERATDFDISRVVLPCEVRVSSATHPLSYKACYAPPGHRPEGA
jgi:hypothetical protein